MSEAQAPPNGTELEIHPLRASDALVSRATFEADVHRWQKLIESGALPRHVRTPGMAITLARAGELYGWDPIRSLRSLFIVEGRVEMWAQDMLGLIRERCPEATVQPVEISAKRVAIRVFRPPQMTEPFEVVVTREQFAHVRLKTEKGNPTPWAQYPEDMLWARCVSRIARRFFSDVTAGAYAVGEIEEKATVRVRQVGPREVPMPGEEPKVEDAEVVSDEQRVSPTHYERMHPPTPASEPLYDPAGDCDLCGGEDGQHTDLLCPNRGVAEEYSDPPPDSDLEDGPAPDAVLLSAAVAGKLEQTTTKTRRTKAKE